eukprot:TRINITY_DN4032_c0_g1_i2.p1 TRINITY_DN4032_c0_g1~~TRINITY_DN4032_c0_g1_i2.p1  ORF type:complete len:380 (-),score=102.45 TRINITY_DN4032_c0_g1_i2:1140-2243(-)
MAFLFKKKPKIVPVGVFTVLVVEAKDLKSTLFGGNRDTYLDTRVVTNVQTGEVPRRSLVCTHTLCPKWNQEFIFNIYNPRGDFCEVRVFDKHKMGSDEILGVVEVYVNQQIGKCYQDGWWDLMNPTNRNQKMHGALHLVVLYSGEGQVNPPLPTGWEAKKDTHGRVFWFNKVTRQSVWVPPTEASVPAAAPSPAQTPVANALVASAPGAGAPAEVPMPMYQGYSVMQVPPTAPGFCCDPNSPSGEMYPTLDGAPPAQGFPPGVPPGMYPPAGGVYTSAPPPGQYPPAGFVMAPSPVLPATMQVAQSPANPMVAFLTENGLMHLQPLFEKERIDLEVLAAMTSEELKQLGVESFGDRKKIELAMAKRE